MLFVGIDPSKVASAIAAVEWRGPDARPLLRLCRCIGDGSLAEVSAAADAAWTRVLGLADGRGIRVAAEINYAGPGAQAHDAVVGRLYLVLGGAWSAGHDLGRDVAVGHDPAPADVAVWTTAGWAKRLGLPRAKQGAGATRGLHRLAEAERIVECGDALRGGDHLVDRAEAVLLAAAEAYRVHEITLPDTVVSKAKSRVRKGRAA